MKQVNIALLGCGTVGSGVIELLQHNGALIEEQLHTKISVKRVLVQDVEKYSNLEIAGPVSFTDNFQEIIQDDDISVVVEVMGSADFARECIEQCFHHGKSVVSANKDLIADYGIPLLKLSNMKNVDFQFEASVAGGVPIVRAMYASLNSNRISEIIGIMNGTTNYILSQMTERGISYQQALEEAQAKGYAEADPTNDVSGYDAARKIAILGTLGFHAELTFRDVRVEGIEKITAEDIKHAAEMGYVIKLLAIARQDEEGISLNVHPGLIRKNHPLANVTDAYNAICVRGNCVGDVMFYGAGAGSLPTASAVVSDLMNVVMHLNIGMTGQRNFVNHEAKLKSQDRISSPYYLRLMVKNSTGVLADTANVLATYGISIRSLIQKDETAEVAEVVLLIDSSADSIVQQALKKLESLACIYKIANAIRVIEV